MENEERFELLDKSKINSGWINKFQRILYLCNNNIKNKQKAIMSA